jgi:hypothetical protein
VWQCRWWRRRASYSLTIRIWRREKEGLEEGLEEGLAIPRVMVVCPGEVVGGGESVA